MNVLFRRQLVNYVQYHLDPINCVMHVFGIIFLFLGAVLPLTLWPFPMFGVQTNAATFMVIPILAYWVFLDAAIGLAIVGAAIVLLLVAVAISSFAGVTTVWTISITLIVVGLAAQIVGHQVFEARHPSLIDHPAHLFLGPMFVMAQLIVALGFRDDLASILQQGSQSIASTEPVHQPQRHINTRQDA